MTTVSLTLTDRYHKAAQGVRELFALGVQGRNNSPEADAVRDRLEILWSRLSESERQRVERLSADLDSLETPPPGPAVVSPAGMQKLAEVFALNQMGAPDRALDLLFEHRASMPLGTLSYVRALCRTILGDLDSALLFAEHAAQLLPNDAECAALVQSIKERKLPRLLWEVDLAPTLTEAANK